MVEPLHTTGETGCTNCADGFTVIVKVTDGPVHVVPALVYVGVTTIVATTGETPLFTAVKAGIAPVPFDANPIEEVSFVQE